MDTQPKGGAAAGGTSREEAVDRIAEDLLAKVRLIMLQNAMLGICPSAPSALGRSIDTQHGSKQQRLCIQVFKAMTSIQS